MIQCVCFDMDGVLFDTENLGGAVMAEAAEAQGCPLTESQWKSLIGTTMAQTSDRLREWCPALDVERFLQDWARLMLEHVRKNGMPKKPGADQVLAWLRAQGMHLALCSSNVPDIIREYMTIAGWDGVFEAVITLDQVHSAKPSPDMYLRAAELIGVKPDHCIGVEDSFSGIRSVRAAGMTSVMIPDVVPYREEDMKPYVDHLLTSLGELPGLIQRIRQEEKA